MFDMFLTAEYVPFTIALCLLFGLMLMELVFALMGGTILGMGADVDGPDIDIDAPDLADLDIDFDGIDMDAAEIEVPSFEEVDAPDGASGMSGPAAWLGFGKMPALIWLGSVLMSFGIAGLVLQSLAGALFGGPLAAGLVAVPAGAFAIWFTRGFGAIFARIIPKTETESVSERHLGRRTGIVTQGTAARGRPAEVRVTDRFGNIHHLRAEPLNDKITIAQGTEVLVLRHRYDGGYLLVPLTD
jgi:hypothetical protein